MIIYQRDIFKKLLFLRFLFFLLIVVAILAYKAKVLNLFYFSVVSFIMLSIIVTKNFIINDEFLKIEKYYFFGWVRFRRVFKKQIELSVLPERATFGLEGDFEAGAVESEIGCLLTIIGFFLPNKIIKQDFYLEQNEFPYELKKGVYIRLDQNEFNLLEKFKK